MTNWWHSFYILHILIFILTILTYTFYVISYVSYTFFRRYLRRWLEIGQQVEISVADIIEWAQELEISMNQIQKAYEWRISQWSIFGKAVLTSAFAFVSGATVALLKGELQVQYTWDIINICIGLILALATYCVSLYQINRLRKEYIALYRIIELISKAY